MNEVVTRFGIANTICCGRRSIGTKYQGEDVGRRCRELLRETAQSKEGYLAGSINRDHVHMLIGIPPRLSVSRWVQLLKGKSLHKLLPEYTQLKKQYWRQHLWARGYWVATAIGRMADRFGFKL